MRQVLVVMSAVLGLACAGCADTYGPNQYAGVYPGPNYYYYYPDYGPYPNYTPYYPYYAAPFVGLGVGGVFFSEQQHRFHDHDFDRFHGVPPGGVQRTAPMSLGAAMRQAAPVTPPPAAPPPSGPMSLGAAIRQGVLGHQ